MAHQPRKPQRFRVEWQEHELGYYPIIALIWEDGMLGAPWNYLSRCEAALAAFENGGELPPGSTMPAVRSEDEDPDEPFNPDEPPPEPHETLNALEHQRYISKLIHWGFEASKRERSRRVGFSVRLDGAHDLSCNSVKGLSVQRLRPAGLGCQDRVPSTLCGEYRGSGQLRSYVVEDHFAVAATQHGAKIPDIKNPLEGLRFHDLRHSTATKLLEQGTPIAVVAHILGWSASTAVRMAKRYGHIRPEAQRQALGGVATQEIQTGVHQFVHQPGRGLQSTLPN